MGQGEGHQTDWNRPHEMVRSSRDHCTFQRRRFLFLHAPFLSPNEQPPLKMALERFEWQ